MSIILGSAILFQILAAAYRNERWPVTVWNVSSISNRWDEDVSVCCILYSSIISTKYNGRCVLLILNTIVAILNECHSCSDGVASEAGQELAWCDHADEYQRPPEQESSVLSEVSQGSLLTCRRTTSCNSPNLASTMAQATMFIVLTDIMSRCTHMMETMNVVIASFANFSDTLIEREMSVNGIPEILDVVCKGDWSPSNWNRHQVLEQLYPLHWTKHNCLSCPGRVLENCSATSLKRQ